MFIDVHAPVFDLFFSVGRYDGLVRNERCHVRGVLNFASGDKYLGEFKDNEFEGDGVYVWKSGTIYRGRWKNGLMHGCGVKLSKQPNGRFISEEGEFIEDEWRGITPACKLVEARRAASQADIAAEMAKAFLTKGGVSSRSRIRHVHTDVQKEEALTDETRVHLLDKLNQDMQNFMNNTKKMVRNLFKH